MVWPIVRLVRESDALALVIGIAAAGLVVVAIIGILEAYGTDHDVAVKEES